MRQLALTATTAVATLATEASAADIASRLADLHDHASGCSINIAEIGRALTPVWLDCRLALYLVPCEDFGCNVLFALYLAVAGNVRSANLPSAELAGSTGRPNQLFGLS